MSTAKNARSVPAGDSAGTKSTAASNTFEGKVVSLSGGKLVMKNKEGKEYSHTLAKDAKVTCDGTDCEPEALQVGNKIRVTTRPDDRKVATCIEALDENTEFEQCS